MSESKKDIYSRFKFVAVQDGVREAATWGLYVQHPDAIPDDTIELIWPKDWPTHVNAEFLKDRGFEIVIA